MAKFGIYQHPGNEVEAVKRGWSWPGFIFVGFWALYKKLWIIGSAVLVLSLVLHAFLPFSVLPFVFDLMLGLVLGYFGNNWRETNLVDRGFELMAAVEAKTPEGALGEYFRGDGRDATPLGNFVRRGRIEPTF